MYNEGINEYKIAEQLKQLNIHGTFTGIPKPGLDQQRMERIAYFSGIQFYALSKKDVNYPEVLSEIRRYKIDYYFTYDSVIPVNEQGQPFKQINMVINSDLMIFLIHE